MVLPRSHVGQVRLQRDVLRSAVQAARPALLPSELPSIVRALPHFWLSRPLRGSCRKENTPAEQVEAGATVHLPLDQLEPSDLPLGLAAAPRRRERRPDRGTVLLQPRRKPL